MNKQEELAKYAHNAWSGWMEYLFSKANVNENGTWTMPKDSVDRWYRQMNTEYKDLPENEKKSDREEATKIMAIVNKNYYE